MGFEIVGLEHVQLAMPAGREEEAEAFYSGLLGLARCPQAGTPGARGGCWFGGGAVSLHLGVEEDFRPARKAHPALVVLRLCRPSRGLWVTRGWKFVRTPSAHRVRAPTSTIPSGNRIELIAAS